MKGVNVYVKIFGVKHKEDIEIFRSARGSLIALKRLYLVKTTRWQHRFFDLASLSPMWLGTYEYMKNTLQNFFFRFETGLPEWIFQIWSKIVKSDRVFVYMKKSLF